ncbi:MAG: NO-inducible flavohemoprotein, partial [Planctomycetaceae bacterium]|nr:NO-inducible flavohemoprotein [Planctomycetaceae bacterium]
QYSLCAAPKNDQYCISVKRKDKGTVSNYLHDHIQIGDTVMLAPPAGDFFLDVAPETPVTLISAGVGLTPMLAMLESLTDHKASVNWLHATENKAQHAYRTHVRDCVSQHPQLHAITWYNHPLATDLPAEDYDYQGLMDLSKIQSQLQTPNMQFYFCGPVGFMQSIAKQLSALGIPSEHMHYE